MAEPNPYSPPQAAQADVMEAESVWPSLPLWGAWTMIFLVNLIVPLLFASQVIQTTGWLGVLGAVVIFYAVGCWLCLRLPKIGRMLNVGSLVNAVTQVVPLQQLICGVIGLNVTMRLGQARYGGETGFEEITTELGGFIATMVSGGLMAAVALVIGVVICSAQRVFKRRKPI